MGDRTRLSMIRMMNDPETIRIMASAANAVRARISAMRHIDTPQQVLHQALSAPMPEEASRAFEQLGGESLREFAATFQTATIGSWLRGTASMAMGVQGAIRVQATPSSDLQVKFDRIFKSIRAAEIGRHRHHRYNGNDDDDDDVSVSSVCWMILSIICAILFYGVQDAALRDLAENKDANWVKKVAHAAHAGPGGNFHYRAILAERKELDTLAVVGGLADLLDIIAGVWTANDGAWRMEDHKVTR